MIYFGPYNKRPVNVEEVPDSIRRAWPDRTSLPYSGQALTLEEKGCDWWTNNPYLLDEFEPEEIMVLYKGWWKRLDHIIPDIHELYKHFKSGELVIDLFQEDSDSCECDQPIRGRVYDEIPCDCDNEQPLVSIREGHVRKDGVNPDPKTPKPNITPVGQSPREKPIHNTDIEFMRKYIKYAMWEDFLGKRS